MSERRQFATFFTIVARNYVAYARTLCQSVAQCHPEARIVVGISDEIDDATRQALGAWEVVGLEQLDIPDLASFTYRYGVMELSTAIKPFLFRWIFRHTDAEQVVYLDPDILMLAPMTRVFECLDAGSTAVLTPHLTARIDDGGQPDEETMLRVGAYNLGFIGLSRGALGNGLIPWWCDRLERRAVVDLENGLFTDQKWVDLVPGLFPGVHILRDPEFNVAYWNLPARRVQQVQGRWMVDDRPLCFFHFSGVDPDNTLVFSKHQNRYSPINLGEVAPLWRLYVERLQANGHAAWSACPYAHGFCRDGVPIHPAMRHYFRRFLDDAGDKRQIDPFDAYGDAYFNAIEPRLRGNRAVTRFMYGLYLHQPELQRHFDLTHDSAQRAYVHWFVESGASLYGVDERWVAASRPVDQVRGQPGLMLRHPGRWVSLQLHRLYARYPGLGQQVTRWLPPRVLAVLKGAAFHTTPSSEGPRGGGEGAAGQGHGITVVGYARGAFGVAEIARACVAAVSSQGYPVDVMAVQAGAAYQENDQTALPVVAAPGAHPFQLYCVNADQMPVVQNLLGPTNTEGRYRIGCWFWELPHFPVAWRAAFELVHELWAPSRFVQDALSRVSPRPVVHMPVAIEFAVEGVYARSSFGLPAQPFLFLFSYDFHSYTARKNPQAVLASFQRAFPPPASGVGLVIKTMYGDQYPEELAALKAGIASDPRIHLLDEAMSRDAAYGLIQVCDCYVSLHRSEGFGLGMAEAMYLGKPVIATGYSGNMDFMDAASACLVRYELTAVPEGAYPHWEGQVWAEPDLEHAVELMREIFSNPARRDSVSRQAMAAIRQSHSRERVGGMMIERLNALAAQA